MHINAKGKKNNFFSVKDKDAGFTGDDVLEGITAVVSVKMPEIQFEGQTKAKLGSVEARGAVETVFGEAFNTYLEENPDDAKAIINKVIDLSRLLPNNIKANYDKSTNTIKPKW